MSEVASQTDCMREPSAVKSPHSMAPKSQPALGMHCVDSAGHCLQSTPPATAEETKKKVKRFKAKIFIDSPFGKSS